MKMRRERIKSPVFEEVGLMGTGVTSEIVSGPELRCVYHYHPEFELTYVEAGSGSILIGRKLELFQPGHLALFGGNLPHNYITVPAPDRGNSQALVVKFSRQGFACLFQLREMTPVRELLEAASQGVVFRLEDSRGTTEKIHALHNAPELFKVPRLLMILAGLAVSNYRVLENSLPGGLDDFDSRRLKRGLEYIHAHFRKRIYLAGAAKAAGVSLEVFGRMLRRMVRKNFSGYLTDFRLAEVERMLADTSLGIAEIANRCGFSNLANFNRLFRKRHGTAPREFRRRLREAAKVEQDGK